MKMNNKSCTKCNEPIKKDEKHAMIITKKGGRILEMERFHFECWKRHFEESVEEEIRKRRLIMVKHAT